MTDFFEKGDPSNMSSNKSGKKGGINLDFSVSNTVVPLAKPAIDLACEQINASAEQHRQLIEVPELYSKGFPLSVEQAIKQLEERGLTYELIPLSLNDASEKYWNCISSQVIETLPAAKQKVKPGSRILVKYITQDVIDKSKEMYDHAENQKLLQKEKAKQAVSDAFGAAKKGVQKIPSIFAKKDKKDQEE